MPTFFDRNRESLTPAEQKEQTEQLRRVAQFMQLFDLCRYKRCFRDEVCMHDPGECVSRYAPLAPEGARTFTRTLIENNANNDDDIDRLNLGDEDGVEEFMDWRSLLDNARKPSALALKRLFARSEDDDVSENET